ncbi:MAG TPA: hypothetical protein VLJ14_10375 [Ktedonobacterales bacterium]|jgi:hypothetical protein|nr:hypothetical protein [Ktedonobacterales bacterium]
MPPDAIAFLVTPLVLMLAIMCLAIAARTYSSLTANPWWRLPRPRLFRSLTFQVLAFLGGSALLALVLAVTGREHLDSLSDFLQAWMGAIEAMMVLFVPGFLLGHGWYALTHWIALRRSAASS